MPPWTCVLRFAQRLAAGAASVAATAAAYVSWSPPVAAAFAASHTALVASSLATAMFAQWCFTAWNIAIGRPNCRRSFA
jgi:hypothetical protein